MTKTYTGNTLTWAHWFDIDGFDTIADARAEVEIMLRKYNYSFTYDPKSDNWSVVYKRVNKVLY